MNILQERLAGGLLVFDGATGTELYKRNFFVNTCYEQLNLTRPEIISEIHRQYFDAGADVLTANTFSANPRKLGRYGLADRTLEINRAGVALARAVAGDKALVAGSLGPAGEPESETDHRSGSELLQAQIAGLTEADFIIFESIRSLSDLEAALDAAAAFPELPYVVSFAFDPAAIRGGTDDLERFVSFIAEKKATPTAIGLNCGCGPDVMLPELEKALKLTPLPVIVQPNAGAPRGVDGRMLYMTTAEYFSTYATRYAQLGCAAVGGCCGIAPFHIEEAARTLKPLIRAEKSAAVTIPVPEKSVEKPEIPQSERSALGRKLAAWEFVCTVEITPPNGFDLKKTLAGARRCHEAGIDAVNLPDGPRASARISPLVTAIAIEREVGIATIPHCCCRDRSLIGLQAELLGYAGAEIHNLLFITGDPPKLGDYPFSSGVFDTDAIGLVKLQRRMNRGLDLGGRELNAPTQVVIGVGADPNAIDPEREYRRTCEKAEAGADFIVTQPVFDPEALLNFLRRIGHLKLPVIAGIWPLASLRNAQFMRDEVPGVTVPDAVMRRMASSDAKELQREAGIEIAREILAAVRGAVAGVQLSAPFGNVDTALRVLKERFSFRSAGVSFCKIRTFHLKKVHF